MDGSDFFTQLTFVLGLGALIAVVMRLLKQPLIIGHIVTGILAGPALLNIIHDKSGFEVLSTLGVALLLFIVGLELSLKVVSRLSKVVFVTTIAQVSIMTAAGAVAARLLHFGRLESIIIGLCLAMSSTIIIVTLLHNKKESTRLYAQITIGILLLQDVVATVGKIILSAKAENSSLYNLGFLIGRGILVTAVLYLLSKYVLPQLVKKIQKSKELLIITSVAWALGIATIFAKLGFSIEVGALFAGVSLAGLSASHEISTRLRPLRDFFIVIFFITLGHTLLPNQLKGAVVAAIVFSLLVFVVKPLIVLITLGIMGYTKRASFRSAISMSQISEFSLVFVVAAVHGNFVGPSVQAAIGLTALITFAGSAYLIKYDDEIYNRLEKHLRLFERRVTRSESNNKLQQYPVVLFGYRKGGAEFIRTFKAMKKRFVVVDYDPEAVELIERQQVNYLYGDATDAELIEELNLEKSKLVVSTISDFATNEFLANWLKTNNPAAVFVTSADTAYQAARLYSEGAAYVMMPHFIGSEKISTFIKKSGFSKTEFHKYREKHLQYLETHYSEEPA